MIIVDKNRPLNLLPEQRSALLGAVCDALLADVLTYEDCINIMNIVIAAYQRRKEEMNERV